MFGFPKLAILSLIFLLSVEASTKISTFSAKYTFDAISQSCELIQPVSLTQQNRRITTLNSFYEKKQFLSDESTTNEKLFLVEIFGASAEIVQKQLHTRCPTLRRAKRSTNSLARDGNIMRNYRKLVDSGDPSNRIDVVFMGDGYTQAEESKFFADMERLTEDMFTGDTFAEYLPVFNIWALHEPSNESGIGVGGRAKDTAFGLYRSGTELRGIYCSKKSAARSACKSLGNDACDFPSLIGNDDFYGGLGGEFTISTRSETSGTLVLRHEMGHNFGNVGEEYDGGSVYSGANSARSLSSVSWKHWLTGELREEKSNLLVQEYMWYDLQNGPYTIDFRSSGSYKKWTIQLTASGVDTDDSFSIELDGKPLEWKSNGLKDRSFYSWKEDTGLTAGSHRIVVRGGGSFDGSIIKQLCSLRLHEYMDEDEYQMEDQSVISAYPTWNYAGTKTYRPDDELCLMRNMLSDKFCPVDIENMWLKFMERIEFIDSLEVDNKNVTLNIIPLGQFRTEKDTFRRDGEKYEIKWFLNGNEKTEYRDMIQIDNFDGSSGDTISVQVKFITPSVRSDPNNFMKSTSSAVLQ